MKKINKLFVAASFFIIVFTFNSCNPFDDVYLSLAMDVKFSTIGIGTDIFLTETMCLSDFEDYDDNRDNLEEIKYISSAYLTLNATQGLQGDNLTLTLYEADGTTLLFQKIIPNFVAASYINSPLEIVLTQPEINNINAYLINPKEDKCFVATLAVSNVQSSSTPYQLTSKLDFLTELKVKP